MYQNAIIAKNEQKETNYNLLLGGSCSQNNTMCN